jgi:hypothetical protein
MTQKFKNGIFSSNYLITTILLLAAIMLSGVSAQDLIGAGESRDLNKQMQNLNTSNLTDTSKKWAVTFTESPSQHLDPIAIGNLEFIQIGNDIFGYGNLTTNKKIQRFTVAGYLNLNLMNLYLVTPGGSMMHKLDIALEGKALSGTYENYTSSIIEKTGAITGRVIEESTIKNEDQNSQSIVCGVGMGLTPSKEAAKDIEEEQKIEDLVDELNLGGSDQDEKRPEKVDLSAKK